MTEYFGGELCHVKGMNFGSISAFLHTRLKIRTGWSGGAMVLGKLPVPGRFINFEKGKAMAYCAYSRCESIFSLFCLSLFERRLDKD